MARETFKMHNIQVFNGGVRIEYEYAGQREWHYATHRLESAIRYELERDEDYLTFLCNGPRQVVAELEEDTSENGLVARLMWQGGPRIDAEYVPMRRDLDTRKVDEFYTVCMIGVRPGRNQQYLMHGTGKHWTRGEAEEEARFLSEVTGVPFDDNVTSRQVPRLTVAVTR